MARAKVMSPLLKSRRNGSGFSIAELKEAGLNIDKARGLKIRFDRRRRSVIKENVGALKIVATKA